MRVPCAVFVQLRPGALKPLGDEPALEFELGLGDLSRHEQPDGAVLFHLDAPQVSLGLGDLLLRPAAPLGTERVDTGDDQVGVRDYPLHLAPYRFFQPLGANEGTLPSAQAHALHSVAHVVAAGSGKLVAVLLDATNVGGAPGASSMEVVAALAASEKGLHQEEHVHVPLGLPAPLPLQRLCPLPGLVVDEWRHRNLNPGVPRLVVDLDSVLGGDVTVLAVGPGARVSGIPQDVLHPGLKPQQLARLGGDALVGQQHGNRIGPQPLIDVHLEDAAHDLGLLINRLGPSVVSDAVSVGGPPVGRRPCLAVPRLPSVDGSLKLSSSILPMAALRPKLFMSMASMLASSRIWCASTTSMRAAAGYILLLRRSDFQQTMVSKCPRRASASIHWNSGRFFDHPLPTSWLRAVIVSPLLSQ